MRAKIYRVDSQQILDIVSGMLVKSGYISLPTIVPESLPDDAEIHHVIPRPDLRGFGVVVLSETFEDIPDGQFLPWHDRPIALVRVLRLVEEIDG